MGGQREAAFERGAEWAEQVLLGPGKAPEAVPGQGTREPRQGGRRESAVHGLAFQRDPPGSILETVQLGSSPSVSLGHSPGTPSGAARTATGQPLHWAAASALSVRTAFGTQEGWRDKNETDNGLFPAPVLFPLSVRALP